MSGDFYYLLPIDVQIRCRHIDRVIFKGSRNNIDIYTFDITNLDNVGELNIVVYYKIIIYRNQKKKK